MLLLFGQHDDSTPTSVALQRLSSIRRANMTVATIAGAQHIGLATDDGDQQGHESRFHENLRVVSLPALEGVPGRCAGDANQAGNHSGLMLASRISRPKRSYSCALKRVNCSTVIVPGSPPRPRSFA